MGHTGGPGLGDILHFPEEQLSIVVLTNQQKYFPYMAEGIADKLLNRSTRVPPDVEDPNTATTSRLRQLVADSRAGHVPSEAFAGRQAEGLVSMLRDIGPTYFASLGAVTHFDLLKVSGTTREYRAWFGGKPIRFTFDLDNQDRVTLLEFQAE